MEPQRWYYRAWRMAIRLCAVLGALLILVTVTPVNEWWASALAGRQDVSSGDVLIVLGGDALSGDTMGWSSYLRSVYSVRSFAGFRFVVVSGGSRSGEPVARLMVDWMRCHGIPADRIRTESASLSTRENALYARALVENLPGTKVLLTSDYHMFRARRVFARAGMNVLPHPVPDVTKRSGFWAWRWWAFTDLVTETAKIAYYKLRGWI